MKTKSTMNNDNENTDQSSEVPEEYKKPFDAEKNTTEEILFNCGKFGLPKEHAVSILRNKLSVHALKQLEAALRESGSEENQHYADGIAAGEAEIATALHGSVLDADKDAYKSFSAENRRKAINNSIRKNFGIGDEEAE